MKKTLDPEVAEQCWPSLLSQWSLTEKWIEFITSEGHQLRYVNRDVWDELYLVTVELKPDLSNRSEVDVGAWPSVIDDFVNHLTNN